LNGNSDSFIFDGNMYAADHLAQVAAQSPEGVSIQIDDAYQKYGG
jgi:hypothetical protein